MRDDRPYPIHIGETPIWFIPLQLHGVAGRVELLKVRWRNIRMHQLK